MVYNVMKKSRYVFNMLGMLYCIMMVSIITLELDEIYMKITGIVVHMSLLIAMICARIFGKYSYKLYIGSDGVKFYKRNEIYLITWDEIESIFISADSKGEMNRNCMICFYNGEYLKTEIKDIKDYSKDYFGVQYRREIIKEIEKYWNKQIWGLYEVEGKDCL